MATTRHWITILIVVVSDLVLSASSFLIGPKTSSSKASSQLFANYGGDDQATEAVKSLVQYHEGKWKGSARSFTVVPDTAAGIVQRKTSPEYEVSIRLGLNSKQKFALQESFSWNDEVFSRSLSVNDCNMDVDSVDASYSLDTNLPDFPAAISGSNKVCQFAIEHCIAASETCRIRCFAMYGVDQSLQRVVVCKENKVSAERPPSSDDNVFTAADLLEMQSDVDRLVDKLTGGSSSSAKSIDPDFPLSRPEDNMASGAGSNNMDNIPASDDGARKISLHDISMLELSSGVWLGDAIVRDHPLVAGSPMPRGRGFAGNPSSSSSSRPSEFGDWSVGVQKIAWRWMWNFGEEIRQIVDVGKAMGAPLGECMSGSLSGSVCVNESLSRRIPKEDRMVYLDLNNDLVGFVTGPVSIQLPRYLNFNVEAVKKVKPFFSEMCVYQAENTEEKEAGDSIDLPELCCSKISRVYNFEGKLKQGCTSFFTFKRFGGDGEIDED